MKKLIVFLALVLAAQTAWADPVTWKRVLSGRQTVSTPGTAVQLSTASQSCGRIVVTAFSSDTGVVSVGGSGVVAATTTRTGTPLLAGVSMTIPISDLNGVFIDATVASEGVSYNCFTN